MGKNKLTPWHFIFDKNFIKKYIENKKNKMHVLFWALLIELKYIKTIFILFSLFGKNDFCLYILKNLEKWSYFVVDLQLLSVLNIKLDNYYRV